MAIAIEWKIEAETIDSYTDAGGNEYSDVVTVVHHRCIASDGADSVEIIGAHKVPRPVSPETFIDLSLVIGIQDLVARRAIILGWADMVDPGFVLATEAAAAARLVAKQSDPDRTFVTVI